MKKIKLGLVGCGAIGSYLAKRIDKELGRESFLAAISDINPQACVKLKKSLYSKPVICSSSVLIKKCDLVIEATSVSGAQGLIEDSIESAKDILVMSVGALLTKANLIRKAREKGSRIYIPSGAIAGVDAFKAAANGAINSIQLITRKPLKTLKDIPYVRRMGINLENSKKDVVVFQGNALQAVYNFPQNINVAATLSLATLGPNKVRVKIIASPKLKMNIHEIEILSDAGKIITRTENLASRTNPKTSYLAMLSAFAMLKSILSPVKIGT